MGRLAHAARVAGPLLLIGAVAVGALMWVQGYRLYVVRTGSMTSAYPTASVVLDAPPAGVRRAGQVATFRTSGGLVTHRLVRRVPGGWVTKGDANRTADPWVVPPRNIVGRVVGGVPRGGYVLIFFAQPTGVPSLVLLSVSVWCSWALFFSETGVDAGWPSARHRRRGRRVPRAGIRTS